jgi:uncharacterized protein HemY
MFNKPKVHCLVKRMLEDYLEASKYLNKVNAFELNNASTLRRCGHVRYILDDNRGALEDLDKADVLEPNNAFTLRIRGNVKRMLHDY